MLSVIVPIYNVKEYLIKCIESILNQKYRQLEILLIDDGSIDGSSKICDRFEKLDCRIRVFHKTNEGLVRARKFGLDCAVGDYITFVDGDDWIEPDMYLKLMEIMENSEVDFVDSGYFYERKGDTNIIKNKKTNSYDLNQFTRHRLFLSLLELDNYIVINPSIWSKVFKSEIIKNSYKKVPDDMQYGEDVISLLYCIMESDRIVQINDAFYHYNYRDNSLSHTKSYSFIRKESMLWNYCGNIILRNDELMTQENIDIFLYKKIFKAFEFVLNGEADVIQRYYFPHIEKLFDKRIVLYGAGKVGKDYLTQISKYERCKIICWVDKKYETLFYKYRKVIGVEEFLEKPYDIVLIAVQEKKTATEIAKALMKKGVLEDKILWHKPEYIDL